jgi:hypothetical protein
MAARPTRRGWSMAEPREDGAPSELPPSDSWTPAQALAAAAKIEWDEVVVVGFTREGEPMIRKSRIRPEQLLWLAEELRIAAIGI